MHFYDTSSLLLELGDAFGKEPFAISNITLIELEKIKTDRLKDWQTKYNARKLLHLLDENRADYIVVRFKESMLDKEPFNDSYEINNDLKILACAFDLKVKWQKEDGITFITDDLNLRLLAEDIGLLTDVAKPKRDRYKGYKELYLDDDELNNLFCDINNNYCNCEIGEYIIIHAKDHLDTESRPEVLRWNGHRYEKLSYRPHESQYMGEVRPMSGDVYQQIAFDALEHNEMVMLTGPAGTGKDECGLSWAFDQLDKKRYSKIVIFCNPVGSKDAAELGFYKGSLIEKLLDSSVGRMLSDKINGGSRTLESLVNMGKIEFVPLVDARGCDVKDAICYVLEAQNLTIELMRLLIQRVNSDSQLILVGDHNTQVDMAVYDGDNNGMRRVAEVFKGFDGFGMVELQNIHRSRFAQKAEEL